jgi:hypothetical protein
MEGQFIKKELNMNVTSTWKSNTNSILHISYLEGWTWKEMHTHDRQAVVPAIQNAGQPVALIVDFSASPLMPPHEYSENIKQSIQDYGNLDIDVVVFALQESAIAGLLVTSHRYYGTSNRVYLTAKTVDEAVQLIHEQRVLQACAV